METQNQQINTPEQPNPKWYLRHNFLWSIALILLLVTAVGIAYVFPTEKRVSEQDLKKPELATEWKTYTNTTYGYSVKYPVEVDQHPEFDSRPDSVGIYLGGNANLLIRTISSEEVQGVKDNEKYGIYKKIDFKGNEAYQYIGLGTAGFWFNTIAVTGSAHPLEIQFSDENDKKKELLEQVLSTFEFTK
jgi:hypothetical protein